LRAFLTLPSRRSFDHGTRLPRQLQCCGYPPVRFALFNGLGEAGSFIIFDGAVLKENKRKL